jgi:hypothetical protein
MQDDIQRLDGFLKSLNQSAQERRDAVSRAQKCLDRSRAEGNGISRAIRDVSTTQTDYIKSLDMMIESRDFKATTLLCRN